MNSNENLPPMVVAKLMRDIRSLCKAPPEGIRVSFNEENISIITAEIDGPEGTPFEGGLFKVRIVLGPDFPQGPPKGYFLTKIFHPNVSDAGEICVNTLKKDWKPTHGIEHVLLVVRCLLIVPNPESALNPEAGKLLLENYDDYFKRAQLMTRIHAKPKKLDVPAKKKSMEEDATSTSAQDSESSSSSSTDASMKESKSSSTAPSPPKKVKSSVPPAAQAQKAVPKPVKKTGLKRL